MKTMASVLLTYTTAVHLIGKFSSIPFIGFAVALLGFPLALKLSIKELFIVEMVGTVFSLTIQADTVFFYFSHAMSVIEPAPFIEKVFYFLIFWGGLLVMGVTLSLITAVLLKLLSRFTPKRLKVVLNET